VLNQLIAELGACRSQGASQDGSQTIQRLWSKTYGIHNVDGGNPNGPNHVSPNEALQAVRNWKQFAPGAKLVWFLHHTPYTMNNIPGKKSQQDALVQTLQRQAPGILTEQGYHLSDTSIEGHWRCLEDYHVSPDAQDVEYFSDSYKTWITTQIIGTKSDGAVMVACKAGVWIEKDEQATRIRKGVQGFQGMAAVATPQVLGGQRYTPGALGGQGYTPAGAQAYAPRAVARPPFAQAAGFGQYGRVIR
jgi:hypothetical protein